MWPSFRVRGEPYSLLAATIRLPDARLSCQGKRPGSPLTRIRIGHEGLSRGAMGFYRTPWVVRACWVDWTALAVRWPIAPVWFRIFSIVGRHGLSPRPVLKTQWRYRRALQSRHCKRADIGHGRAVPQCSAANLLFLCP